MQMYDWIVNGSSAMVIARWWAGSAQSDCRVEFPKGQFALLTTHLHLSAGYAIHVSSA